MAFAIRISLRSLVKTQNYHQFRSIMTSSSRVQKAVEDLKKNPYFEKYSQKIAALQQTLPEEFLARLEISAIAKDKAESSKPGREFSSASQPKAFTSVDKPTDKRLDQIMKLDLVKDKNTDEIQRIWEEYHKHKDVIAAIIPKEIFGKLCESSAKYPLFLFPLPRSQGYEFIVTQFAGNSVHFTPLIRYQAHKENAPECLTITNYTELLDEKGIVLMRGEFDKDVMTAKEAQCLANQLQMYYTRDDPDKRRLLDQFTYSPDEFKHMELISQLENIPLT